MTIFSPFQCYTHRNLGWKIIVVDPGQEAPLSAGSIASSKQLLVVQLTVIVALISGLLYA